jgi:hypothetical protein
MGKMIPYIGQKEPGGQNHGCIYAPTVILHSPAPLDEKIRRNQGYRNTGIKKRIEACQEIQIQIRLYLNSPHGSNQKPDNDRNRPGIPIQIPNPLMTDSYLMHRFYLFSTSRLSCTFSP